MIKQIDDNILVLTIIAAIILSMGGTFTVLTKMTDLNPKAYITGFATNDTGYVNITIIAEVSIDVDDNNDTIDFGVCNSPPNPNIGSINSSYNEATLNSSSAYINCSHTNLPAYLRIINIGNVAANVTIATDKIANGTNSLLSSSNARMFFSARDETLGDCEDNLAIDWTLLEHIDTDYVICEKLDFGASESLRVFINLTIPFDSSTGGQNQNATLTFTGVANTN